MPPLARKANGPSMLVPDVLTEALPCFREQLLCEHVAPLLVSALLVLAFEQVVPVA